MKEITLTELVIDTLHQFFYGGMTALEHEDETNLLEEIQIDSHDHDDCKLV